MRRDTLVFWLLQIKSFLEASYLQWLKCYTVPLASKEAMCYPPVLTLPDLEPDFFIKCDACDVAIRPRKVITASVVCQ